MLVIDATLKEDVSNIRNSKITGIVKELKSILNVHITDPHAGSAQLKHEYSFELTSELPKDYDAVIIMMMGV